MDSNETRDNECVKNVKELLYGWRELILIVYDILLWKDMIYPIYVVSVPTIVLLCALYYDTTLISFMAGLIMVCVLSDAFVPVALSKLYSPDAWTGRKEKKYQNICENIANYYLLIVCIIEKFLDKRKNQPSVYYPLVVCACALMIMIGSTVNSVLVAYLLVIAILLLPGLRGSGVVGEIKRRSGQIYTDTLKQSKKNK